MATLLSTVWTTIFRCALLGLLLLICSGCGGGKPPLGRVWGTIRANGRPLERALVEFQPSQGPSSFGLTNSEGRYELFFRENQPGAIVGEHRVSIRTVETGPESDRDDAGPVGAPVELVPQAYNDYSTLKATVKAGDNPAIDFSIEFDEPAYRQLVEERRAAATGQARGFNPR